MRLHVSPLAAALLVLGLATTRTSAQSPGERARYAVRAARILDPVSGRYSEPSIILVRDGRIVDVLPSARFRPDIADSTIDLGDKTIVPGLIDAHVHLGIGGPVATTALADVRAGFTTVVDLGARTTRILTMRDSVNAGGILGPRVLAAGIWVGVKNGVCEFNGIGIAGGVEDFRARIRENAKAGAEVAKLCVSGWPQAAFAEPLKYEMPDEILRASVEEAHRLGRIVVAHDISLGGVRAALAAGVDGLAHAAYLDSAAAARMKSANMFMIPTLASLTGGDTTRAGPALVSAVTLAHRAGVHLVFGTDGGVLPHGQNAAEFTALVNAGLSPLDAIRAATINAATAFRIADSVGVVRRGMAADLVAVAGDPLQDVRVLERPMFVMSRGRVIR